MRSANLRWLVAGAAVANGCVRGSLPPRPLADDRITLRHAIDSMLAAPDTRGARWGILIVAPDARDTLYSRDAGKLMIPASNMKIVTAAVALDVLGPDFRFLTPVMARGMMRSDTLDGDLLVQGRGDPSVSDHLMGDAMLPLTFIADSLRRVGLAHVTGRVLEYGNAFPDATAGFEWAWEDLETESGALTDELLFNEGIAEIHIRGGAVPGAAPEARTTPARTYPRLRIEATTVKRDPAADSTAQLAAVKDTLRGDIVVSGSIPAGDSATLVVTFRDPDAAYLAALREALRESGITVADSNVDPGQRIDNLLALESPTLAQILPGLLKPSQNQIAEMLFRTVALQATDTGTARVARRVLSDRLRSWGAEPDGFLLWDGSGLSRRDLLSPETIVRVLDRMRHDPHFDVFYDAFPVAGVDGTLRGRMRGTRAEANVRGKTGTLGEVRSFSGYVTTADGRMLLFSILCNNFLVPTSRITEVQDSIAVRLSSFSTARGDR